MGRIFVNNYTTKLTAQLLTGGTTATVSSGDGAALAGAVAPNFYTGTLRRISGFKDVGREIVRITARAGDVLTITRAQESTVALQFEIGDVLDIDITAEYLNGTPSAYADNETPTGTVNGSNVTFTLANTPSPAASLMLFVNGLLQHPAGVHYTLTTNSIAFTVGATPQTGDLLRAYYRY